MATSLARISRRCVTSSVSSNLIRRYLAAEAVAVATREAPKPKSEVTPSPDRVKWDYRGQRQIIPLGQWLPKVAVDAYVAPNVVLAGQVTVWDGSSVWNGAVLRGDLNKITLGFCSNVQERCVVHAAWSSPTGSCSLHVLLIPVVTYYVISDKYKRTRSRLLLVDRLVWRITPQKTILCSNRKLLRCSST